MPTPTRFSDQLKSSLAEFHLLKHPFYQAWMDGELPKENLDHYAVQYSHHVQAFPRYISATHSLCSDIKQRKLLLENLNDEEGAHGTDHPELWAQFVEGLGLSRDKISSEPACESIQNVVDTFTANSRSTFWNGLASLYAYEQQVPEIADSKIEGLKKNYGVTDQRTLEFFEVHKEADVHHRVACEEILDQMPQTDHAEALKSAVSSAKSLWDFLSEMYEPRPAMSA